LSDLPDRQLISTFVIRDPKKGVMKKEILIVEDHLYLQKTLVDWLEKIYPEFEILAADSGEDAIDTVHDSTPSLIIMDLHLPQIDGFEAMRRIKADHPHIPILIMTDLDCDLNKDYAFSAGADAYLLKESIQTELLPKINRLLDRA
jgi:CheY-like chemotaxis protein